MQDRGDELALGVMYPMVSGSPGNAGAFFLLDRDGGGALTLWQSEAAALASDTAADKSRESTIAATGMELPARGRFEVVHTNRGAARPRARPEGPLAEHR